MSSSITVDDSTASKSTETESKPMSEITIATIEEGEKHTEELTSDSEPGDKLMATYQGDIEEGNLVDEVKHNEHIVERALEEDVFFGEIYLPGWFVMDDDDAREEFGHRCAHKGDTVKVRGLIERYSEKAWRIVAKEEEGTMPGSIWFQYAWVFVPVSISTVVRVDGVESREHAFDVTTGVEIDVEDDEEDEDTDGTHQCNRCDSGYTPLGKTDRGVCSDCWTEIHTDENEENEENEESEEDEENEEIEGDHPGVICTECKRGDTVEKIDEMKNDAFTASKHECTECGAVGYNRVWSVRSGRENDSEWQGDVREVDLGETKWADARGTF